MIAMQEDLQRNKNKKVQSSLCMFGEHKCFILGQLYNFFFVYVDFV